MIRYFVIMMVLLVAGGCGGNDPVTGAVPSASPKAATPRQVRVIAAAQETLERGAIATGTLAAEDQVVLGFKVSGRLGKIPVDLGSPVRQGQPVAELDPIDFHLKVHQATAALQQARARLGLPPEGDDDAVDPVRTPLVRQARAVLDDARRNRDRMALLWKQELIARTELDTAESTLQIAEGRYQDALEEVRTRQAILAERRSDVAVARQQLADTVLRATLDGMIRQRHVSVGAYLVAGAPVVTLVRIHPLRLRLAVPERAAADVRMGQNVKVKVDGDPTVYPGKVARLSPAVDEQDRTLLVEATVPNPQGRLRPGAFAEAEIITATDQQAVFVPVSAVVTFAGIEKVLTVRESVSSEARVKTGRRMGDRVETVTGLKPGELVVVQPGNLTEGQPVKVIP